MVDIKDNLACMHDEHWTEVVASSAYILLWCMYKWRVEKLIIKISMLISVPNPSAWTNQFTRQILPSGENDKGRSKMHFSITVTYLAVEWNVIICVFLWGTACIVPRFTFDSYMFSTPNSRCIIVLISCQSVLSPLSILSLFTFTSKKLTDFCCFYYLYWDLHMLSTIIIRKSFFHQIGLVMYFYLICNFFFLLFCLSSCVVPVGFSISSTSKNSFCI